MRRKLYKGFSSRRAWLLSSLVVVLSAGPLADAAAAQGRKDPRRAAVLAGPGVRATRTVTNFADALSCMDNLLLQYGKRDITIINNGIPDATETLKMGTRDMVISTLDAMSLRSGAFKYIDADPDDVAVITMQKSIGTNSKLADYYIKGSISQIDQEVMSGGKKAGLAFDFLSFGASKDMSVTNMALEIGMYNTSDRTAIRGVRSKNTMQVVRTGSSVDVGGLVPFASLLFEVHQDRAQGSHQTVRTLIELSMIELIGKFTKVPYWQCLALPEADPAARLAANEYFSRMRQPEMITATQSALTQAKYYTGPVNGLMSPALGESITRYRVENELGAGPHIDFELYFNFLTKRLVADGEARGRRGTPQPILAAAPADTGLRFDMRFQPVDDQEKPMVPLGSALRLELTPRNRDAYFYCFMAGGDAMAYRIYPNAATGAQPRTPAGTTVQIPAEGSKFSIKLNDVGQERIACVGREAPYEKLPNSVSIAALEAIKRGTSTKSSPLTALDAVVNEHQKLDPTGLHSSIQVRTLDVVPKAVQ